MKNFLASNGEVANYWCRVKELVLECSVDSEQLNNRIFRESFTSITLFSHWSIQTSKKEEDKIVGSEYIFSSWRTSQHLTVNALNALGLNKIKFNCKDQTDWGEHCELNNQDNEIETKSSEQKFYNYSENHFKQLFRKKNH